MVCQFYNCESGWQQIVGEIHGFEIKDKNGNYYPAIAEITGETTIDLRSEATVPEGVRYGWVPFPEPALSLFNKAGFPLGPFILDLHGNSDLKKP